METLKAFSYGAANRGESLMVFDWEKAAKLIKASGLKDANAGLAGDWECTGGNIFENGKPNLDSYTYLAGTWATPEIEIDGEIQDCFKMENDTPGWDAHTKWPQEALDILASD